LADAVAPELGEATLEQQRHFTRHPGESTRECVSGDLIIARRILFDKLKDWAMRALAERS
jgi:hypothetical protein